LTSQTFRRALVYGINRQVILSSELLGNRDLPGCEVISGPFPPGIRDNDPLAYAYDERIDARSWYPRLASILVTLARRELKEIAAKRDEEFTAEAKLVLGYPGNEVARVACQSIAQYLQPIGIEIELLELPQGMSFDPEGRVDLLYQQVAMWEPVIDARRLLAPGGVTSIGNEYVGMALRRLDAARNWREARERLHELHRIVHEQVSVIPLWQTVDYLAYSERLRGVGSAPVTLYQNVEQWQIVPAGTDQVEP
jgi:ABC-type transport system substrate-binding protein